MSGIWTELMREVSDDTLREASAEFHNLDFHAGEVVMAQGAEDPILAVVLDGEVQLLRDGRVVDTVGADGIIGAMSMVRNRPRISEVRTTRPTRVLLLELDAYNKLVAAHNPVVYRLEHAAVTQMADRLRNLNSLVRERSQGEADRYRRPAQRFFAALRNLVGGGGAASARDLDAQQVLGSSPLFVGEPAEVIADLARAWEPAVFASGNTLCEQGDEADGLYLLGHGKADVYVALAGDRVHKLGSVGPGDAVGMTAMLDGKPRGATVIAVEQVDALKLTRERHDELIQAETPAGSALRRAVIRGFADQVQEAGDNVVSVTPLAELPNSEDILNPGS